MSATKFYLYFPLDDQNYLLLNTITGALDIVEGKIISYLDSLSKNGRAEDIEADIQSQLEARGYLIPPGRDQEQLKQLHQIYRKQHKLGSFIICPTFSCNLRCPYCFEDLEIRKKGKVLEEAEVDLIFDAITSIFATKEFKKGIVELYGGEPFQTSTEKIIPYILRKAQTLGYPLKAITNGTNLARFQKVFKEFGTAFQYLQITLDGPKEIHDSLRVRADKTGTYDEIVANIDLMLSLGIHIGLRLNLGKDNIRFLPQMLELFNKKGWNQSKLFSCQLAPITDHFCTGTVPNWLPESELLERIYHLFEDFETIRQDYHLVLGTDLERRTALIRSIWAETPKDRQLPNPSPCGAGARSFYVFCPDGNIYACPESIGRTEFAVGRFLPDFFLDPQKERLWDRNVTNIPKCRECNIAGLCGSSCVWSSLATGGAGFEEPVCNFAHETVENFLVLNKARILKKLGESQ